MQQILSQSGHACLNVLLGLGLSVALVGCRQTSARGSDSAQKGGAARSAESSTSNTAGDQQDALGKTSTGTATSAPAVGASVGAQYAGDASCPDNDAELCRIETQILELVNQLRASKSLPAFSRSKLMSVASRSFSIDMGKKGFISHQGFPNARYQVLEKIDSLARTKVSLQAENVVTYSSMRSEDVAARFFNMWNNSFGHRANMLGRYASIGIGVTRTASGGWYGTQIFGSSREP